MSSIFTDEFLLELKVDLLTVVEKYLKSNEKTSERKIDLISAKEVQEIYGIEYRTLKRWQEQGLKSYSPPVEGTKKTYYKISEINKFMGAD